MDVSNITQLISSVGFPIVVSGALFWQLNKQNEQHLQESKEMKEAINELRTAIVQLTTHLTSGKLQ